MLKFGSLSMLLVLSAQPASRPDEAPQYREEDDRWSVESGNNSIKGVAHLTADGEDKICSGEKVGLRPHSPLADYRIKKMFGNQDRGRQLLMNLPNSMQPTTPELPTEPPETYASRARSVTCEDGKFEFKNLPDGSYYITSLVVSSYRVRQSGPSDDPEVLMRSVTLKGGEEKYVDFQSP